MTPTPEKEANIKLSEVNGRIVHFADCRGSFLPFSPDQDSSCGPRYTDTTVRSNAHKLQHANVRHEDNFFAVVPSFSKSTSATRDTCGSLVPDR